MEEAAEEHEEAFEFVRGKVPPFWFGFKGLMQAVDREEADATEAGLCLGTCDSANLDMVDKGARVTPVSAMTMPLAETACSGWSG